MWRKYSYSFGSGHSDWWGNANWAGQGSERKIFVVSSKIISSLTCLNSTWFLCEDLFWKVTLRMDWQFFSVKWVHFHLWLSCHKRWSCCLKYFLHWSVSHCGWVSTELYMGPLSPLAPTCAGTDHHSTNNIFVPTTTTTVSHNYKQLEMFVWWSM